MAEAQSGSGYATEGGEYPGTAGLPGDQVKPEVAVGLTGGFLVFQDNAIDGQGLGIGLQRLDPSLSAAFSVMRVNSNAADDQENPALALLKTGGAVVAFQGGKLGFQQVYARFLAANNTWLTSDVQVNTATNVNHLNPRLATLADGNVLVLWCSFNQAAPDSMQDVFAQRLSPTGARLGGEFRLNQFTAFNQRTPTVAALAGGGFVAVWVSEQQRGENSVDLFARLFDANGAPLGAEFQVNTATNVCANPVVAAGPDGGFLVAWGELNLVNKSDSWDIYTRPFNSVGNPVSAVALLNVNRYGDQYGPRVAADGSQYFAVWTSLRQDGSWEGVFGRFVGNDGVLHGSEVQVNTTTVSKQIHPCVAGDSGGRFVAVWSSFIGSPNSFDLFAQRFAVAGSALAAPDSPFVSGLGPDSLSVAWPAVSGLPLAAYEIYEDGASTPLAATTNNFYTRTGLTPGATRSYRVAYVLTDDRRSPQSAAGVGTTWGADSNGDGLPDDWQALYWGPNQAHWQPAGTDSDGDGDSNLKEFQAGTIPLNAQSVFKVRLDKTEQGTYLIWNSQPGFVYQVETTTDLNNPSGWVKLGEPRFAAGPSDQVLVTPTGAASSYRVNRLH